MLKRDEDGDLHMRLENGTTVYISRTDAMYPEGGVRVSFMARDAHSWTYLTDAEAKAIADAIGEKAAEVTYEIN